MQAECPRSSAVPFYKEPDFTLARLDELQGHAVALTDRQIFGAVLLAKRQRRRQGPDAFRVIRGVLRICVYLAGGDETEARGLCQLAHSGHLQIAALDLTISAGLLR